MPNFILQPNGYVIVCTGSAVAAMSALGSTITVTSFPSLDNNGEILSLSDASGKVIHALTYDISWYQNELNQNGIYVYNPDHNKELQLAILSKLPKSSDNLNNQLGSTRKAINQCIKLGFVNPGYQSYHPNTREYLEAKTTRKRKTIFSKIVYSNAKFNSSVTTFHNWNQITFLIDTLVEVGKLTTEE